MGKKTLILLLLFIATKLFSQYGIIEDKEGFVNIREQSNAKSKILDTVHSGRILYFFQVDEQIGEWLDCNYLRNNKNISGYIHKSRVKLIQTLKEIKPVSKKFELIFSNAQTIISIKKEPFIAKNNKLKYRKSNPECKEATYLYKINGKDVFGTDGDIPREQYGKSTISFQGTTIKLDTDKYFCPNLEYHKLNWDEKTDTYYLTASNGDGAGAYDVLWVIKNGKILAIETDIPF